MTLPQARIAVTAHHVITALQQAFYPWFATSRAAGLSIALFITTLLVGCATDAQRRQDSPASAQQLKSLEVRKAAMRGLKKWTFAGRVIIQYHDDAWNGNLQWRQDDGRYEIQFASPMGQSAFRCHGDRSLVTLEIADGRTITGANIDKIMRQGLGMHIPITNMRNWVRGIPSPANVDHFEMTKQNRLRRLAQDGWRVSFRRYAITNRFDLPHLIEARSLDGNMSAKLVIDHWQIN